MTFLGYLTNRETYKCGSDLKSVSKEYWEENLEKASDFGASRGYLLEGVADFGTK